MADYKELLRRAISALPENNGAARRAVYEKARTALVGQLRSITPPLPARDITQHRLQLEDCIRQVEQEASEAVISLGRESQVGMRPAPVSGTFTPRSVAEAPRPVPPPPPVEAEPVFEPEPEPEPQAQPQPKPLPEPEPEPVAEEAPPAPEPEPEPVVEPPPPAPKPAPTSIEDIIALAAASSGVEVSTAKPQAPAQPEPKGGLFGFTRRNAEPVDKPEGGGRSSFFRPRRDAAAAVAADVEPSVSAAALTRHQQPESVVPDQPALTSPRETDLDANEAREAEGAIERAIETLDRAARGESTEGEPEQPSLAAAPAQPIDKREDGAFAAAQAETRSGAGLTIFLIVFALLLVGAGGAGFWAWREGYVDLDQMFGSSQTAVSEPVTNTEPTGPTMDTPATNIASTDEGATGPGNTATSQATEPTSALEGLEDRLEPTPEPVVPNGTENVLPSISNGEPKTEERLSGAQTSIAATDDPAASVDPTNLAGNQSLLLEASADGRSGAVPFSGTVEWTQGQDEIGAPTLVGEASIPARNLGVSITIRKNNDPVLPASHLMEISFDVPDTFVGGSVATLAGVLLKDEELVPGTALAGAAARVVGNSFLFALSASPADQTANLDLLDQRRWLDLALVYGTGRNAILTLEKDEEAQVLFDEVLAAWSAS